jgi:hypothetical protein
MPDSYENGKMTYQPISRTIRIETRLKQTENLLR